MSSYSIEVSGPGAKDALKKIAAFLEANPQEPGESIEVGFERRDEAGVIAKIDPVAELTDLYKLGRGVKRG